MDNIMETKRPNLFDYATSELSQDAFLEWLITWADQEYKKIDSDLNVCAVAFVRELLGVKSDYPINQVEVKRQWEHIDISVVINEKYFIVIEDKKGTKEHSDQLKRYSEIAEAHYSKKFEIKLVYFKMEEQGDYINVKEAGFSLFDRKKMIEIIQHYIDSTKAEKYNDIIVDYYKNLKNLDDKINSFETFLLKDWGWYSWQGFYSKLQKQQKIENGKWQYVPNPKGGFLGFDWNWIDSEIDGKKFWVYLQLEHDKLFFKISVEEKENRITCRDNYRNYLYKKVEELKIDISQFGRTGATMGVAILHSAYLKENEKGYLDFQATVDNLERITKLIKETDKAIQASNKV